MTQRRWLELLPDGYGGIDLIADVIGEVESEQLHRAVVAVVERHTALRTVFTADASTGWRQRVVSTPAVDLIDLRDKSSAEQDAEIGRMVTEAAARPHEVTQRPPFELCLVVLAGDRHALVLHGHHVVFDGWSSSIFFRDIARAMRGELLGIPLQYTDFAVAQERYLMSAALLRERAHWTEHFAGAPAPTRIPERGGNPADGDRGAVIEFEIEPAVFNRLRRRATACGTTVFTLFMAAYALFVHRETGEHELVLGTTAAGRQVPEADDIIGVFVNPMPLRLQVNPDKPVADLITAVAEALTGFHEHGNYSLEDLVAAVPPFIGLGLNDTFHCYLLYQNYWRPDDHDLTFASRPLPPGVHHKLMRDVEVVLTEAAGEKLAGEFWYRADRYSREWAEHATTHYTELLHHFADKWPQG